LEEAHEELRKAKEHSENVRAYLLKKKEEEDYW
jgi:hypothetical protein